MRIGCGNLWRFFGILFVLSGTFIVCQTTSSQSNGTASDPALSQSDTLTIIKEINASEKRILDEIHKLDKDVAVLKTRLDIIQWSLAIIGAPLIIYLATLGAQRLFKRDSRTERGSEMTPPRGRKTDRDESAGSTQSDYPEDIREAS